MTNNHSTWLRGNDVIFLCLDHTLSFACICCLTCCLDDYGIAELLLCLAVLATGHLCSRKDLHSQADSSFSWHDSHHSKLMQACSMTNYTFLPRCKTKKKHWKSWYITTKAKQEFFFCWKVPFILDLKKTEKRTKLVLYERSYNRIFKMKLQYTLPIGKDK